MAMFILLSMSGAATDTAVVVDSDTVTLKAGEGGTHTADLFVVNTWDTEISLDAAIVGDAGCTVTAAPAVPAGRRTKVTLKPGSGCDVATGATISVGLGAGSTPPRIEVKAEPPKKAGPDWAILRDALWWAAIAVVSVVVWSPFASPLSTGRSRSRSRLKHVCKRPSSSSLVG